MAINTQALKAEQLDKAGQIICDDDADFPEPKWIGGADVGFEQDGNITRAVIIILNYPSLTIHEYQIAQIPTTFPYIPGFLSFRECPALMTAWHQIKQKPDLLFVDGHGLAHPRRFGIASHFGLQINIPTIGVAKKKLCGQHTLLSKDAGSHVQLSDQTQQLGWVFRSKIRCNPLYISPGHRISHQSALYWVEKCLRGYRLPEPTRWADAIASRKPAFLRWQVQHPNFL